MELLPFHEIPQEDLRVAYEWELDIEIWRQRKLGEHDEWLSWPELSESDKAHARKWIPQGAVESDAPPVPARAATMHELELFLERVAEAYPLPHPHPSHYASPVHPLDKVAKDGTVNLPDKCLDEEKCFSDECGYRYLPLVICGTLTKKQILEGVSRELDRLMPSLAGNKTHRSKVIESRFYGLLAYRLKTERKTLDESKRLLRFCKAQWSGRELTRERWSDVWQDALEDIENRVLKIRECLREFDEHDTARYGNGGESVYWRNGGLAEAVWGAYMGLGRRNPPDDSLGMRGLVARMHASKVPKTPDKMQDSVPEMPDE